MLRDSSSKPLVAFTFDELNTVTESFRQDYFLGGGGFGRVYKGFVPENFREGLQPLQVAVKVHDGDNSYQGHREWLVFSSYQLNIDLFFLLCFSITGRSTRKQVLLKAPIFFLGRGHISWATFTPKFSEIDWILL